VHLVTEDMLSRVWNEFGFRLDVHRAAQGGHIVHLYICKKYLNLSLFFGA
jgi:hypothetical protein